MVVVCVSPISVSALNVFLFFLVTVWTSGDSTFTCPDLFSLAPIIFSNFLLPKFTCHLTYRTPILILGICLYIKSDLHVLGCKVGYIAVLLFIY